MYRIMIVDDDEILRKGLVQNINWSAHGITVAAEAKNGRDALCRIDEAMPQVIVTDIQMPLMDGLQLTETVSRLYPRIKIVLLTAYEEFEYARKALEYKVSEYVLKYESEGTILFAVQQAVEQVKAETERELLKTRNREIEYKNLFRDICCYKRDRAGIGTQMRDLGIREAYGSYGTVSFKIESLKSMDEIKFLIQTKEWFQAIEDTIGGALKQAGYEFHFFQGKEYLNAALLHNRQDGGGALLALLKQEINCLRDQLGIKLYAGMGRWYEEISCLHESYLEALKVNNLRDVLDRVYPKEENWLLVYSPEMFAEEAMEELVDKVSSYININFGREDLSLDGIAGQVHLSSNYVSTLFKKYCGMNISDYIIKVRMDHADRLLETTNFKTYEIAEKIGYTNAQYFSVLFKKFHGMTPKEFRALRKKED